MRALFLSSTVIFWLLAGGFWAARAILPAPSAEGVAADTAWTAADVAGHRSAADCWMIIGGQVYDFSAYLPEHPANPAVFLPWCGKDASEAYRTKTKGRPHSSYADSLLPNYHIGTLE